MLKVNLVNATNCQNHTLTFALERGEQHSITLEAVTRVLIRTTTDGPLLDDVFTVVVVNDEEFVVPQSAPGSDDLLTALQGLAGFKNEAVIEAMCCSEDREFPCWAKQ